MHSSVYIFLVLQLSLFLPALCRVVDQVDDGDLLHLLTGEDNVITLFTKSNCPECDELESVVDNIHKDLKESLGAVVVKAHNSNLVGIYNPAREPSLIYFRKGIPLLYYGELNGDEILQTFIENRVPVVKELSDDNFEHLTQAASGATTGDWFVFFYSADCVFCQRLYAVWEAVGARLRRRLNVARVNRLDIGQSTAKRFEITESPEFILLRQGKVYRYKSKDYTPKSFIEFAESGYKKQTNPEDVPQVPSLMNEVFADNWRNIIDNYQYVIYALVVILVAVAGFGLRKCLAAKKTDNRKNKSKKAK